ncbi:MAG: protein jag [Treponema sp.]|jgi:spoIIIJ-associated protein|nr:protein jag [Treponema sp.]
MTYEFEGRTEKDAIERAAAELGLQKDSFDVEILEAQRGGLFKKGFVKIRVHTGTGAEPEDEAPRERGAYREAADAGQDAASEGESVMLRGAVFGDPEPKDDFERALADFTGGMIERMGCSAAVSVFFRKDKKIGFNIESRDSSLIIGKKGKNLDALQLLVNIYAGHLGRESTRVILDSENYRIRREETLVRLAHSVADRVRSSRTSVLLEPMNPFDRRLIHTTLAQAKDVETHSEGEGVYRQVRVYYAGARSGGRR